MLTTSEKNSQAHLLLVAKRQARGHRGRLQNMQL